MFKNFFYLVLISSLSLYIHAMNQNSDCETTMHQAAAGETLYTLPETIDGLSENKSEIGLIDHLTTHNILDKLKYSGTKKVSASQLFVGSKIFMTLPGILSSSKSDIDTFLENYDQLYELGIDGINILTADESTELVTLVKLIMLKNIFERSEGRSIPSKRALLSMQDEIKFISASVLPDVQPNVAEVFRVRQRFSNMPHPSLRCSVGVTFGRNVVCQSKCPREPFDFVKSYLRKLKGLH